MSGPRIAIIGFFGECNAWQRPVAEQDYTWMAYFEGRSLLAAVENPETFLLPETRGFFAGMSESGPWEPVPILYAMSSSGPALKEDHFRHLLAKMRAGLEAAGRLDAVYFSGHGSVIATETLDPDGAILEMVRGVVGRRCPVVETLDLHGKVTAKMIELGDLFIAYRTDPHVDMEARGREAAAAMRRLVAGERPHAAYVRLPMMIPTSAIVARTSPFNEIVAYGQSRVTPAIANVSLLPGYPHCDTPYSGFHVVVAAWESQAAARALARDLAERIWSQRHLFAIEMVSVAEAAALALRTGQEPSLPSQLFADVADNPGGGATCNTMWILEAFLKAGVTGTAIGVIFEPDVAGEAHRRGIGAKFVATFNVGREDDFAKVFSVPVTVTGLAPGRFTARRGPAHGVTVDMGPTAALQADGVSIVVSTKRMQALAVEQFEAVGVDVAALRSVVVKSRGHYQTSFAEYFPRDRMHDVDAPGFMTPVLSRLPYRRLNRPLFPMDPETPWTADQAFEIAN